MSTGLLFVLMSLAAFRVTRFLTADTLPLVSVPREWILRHYKADRRSLPLQNETVSWADLWTCPWCLGTYVSAAVVLLTDRYASIPFPVLQGAAIAALVGLLSVYDER